MLYMCHNNNNIPEVSHSPCRQAHMKTWYYVWKVVYCWYPLSPPATFLAPFSCHVWQPAQVEKQVDGMRFFGFGEILYICASAWFDLMFYLKSISILVLTDIQPLCKAKYMLKWEPILCFVRGTFSARTCDEMKNKAKTVCFPFRRNDLFPEMRYIWECVPRPQKWRVV